MKKPLIGISAGVLVDQGGMFPGYKRDYVNEDYITAVSENGGIPVILPLLDDPADIDRQVAALDGLILSGGHDVDPSSYNHDPLDKLGDTSLRRDAFDLNLIRSAKQRQLPILGICRGTQILNVYHGGTLYQDLSYRDAPTIRHWQATNSAQVTHAVRIDQHSRLFTILKQATVRVNSFHHQIMATIGEGFHVVATASDNVPEAIEADGDHIMMGVQWHPEMLTQSQPLMNALFSHFIQQTQATAASSTSL